MILFLYNVALLVVLVLGAPWWIFRMATTRKYREGLAERLGLVKPLKNPKGLPVVWVHAVSVGEVLAVRQLVVTLDAVLPGYFIAISTTTRTGQELARDRFGADRVFYCPLDLPWATRAHLKAIRPCMLVLAETEFWPNLLEGCFRRAIPVVVVNARISDRSWPRYRRLRGLWKGWLGRLSRVLAQSEADAERLRAIGCDPARVEVSGNLKFDVWAGRDAAATRLIRARLGASDKKLRLVVAGSTLEGEEAMLLAAWGVLHAADAAPDGSGLAMSGLATSGLAMVLAPRHPERFSLVAGLLERSRFRWRLRSKMSAELDDAVEIAPGEIVLLDSLGELASVYSLAAVAFVGGSLVAAGGHNPLEPAQFGIPVVMGEHFANFRAIVDAMRAAKALAVVTPGDLAGKLAELLSDRKAASKMGERGRQVYLEQGGATAKTVKAIQALLAARSGG